MDQGYGGSQKKLATTCRQMTRHAIPDGIRNMVIRDQAGTMLQETPLRKGHSRGDNGCPRKQEVIQDLQADSKAGDSKAYS
jgi:hypothetical protein